jgi:subtilisin family serine protease
MAAASGASESGENVARDPGVTSSASAVLGPAGDGPGEIVRLAAPGSPADAGASGREEPSEAILALPKNEAGQIPTDFELGVGAEIRDSFFSPVVCATLARITGPPGSTLEELVAVVPEGSALVRNDVYASAASEIRPVRTPEPPPRPDPYVSLQYSLAVTDVQAVRHLSTGAGVKIALLDSAPDSAHRDLSAARIQPIEGEAPPAVGVHGTLMAGVINAIEGNGFGIVGLAPDAELIPIPVCEPRGTAGGQCTIYDLLRGLDRAWDAEASIVNLSLSGPANVLLERGVARLEALGAVVVAAAGNEGSTRERYPAAYPSVIGVGAIDRDGRLFEASNRGPWVELGAPGVDVLSTVPESAFAFGNGTSLAAAHVTGVLAILTSVTGDPKLARGELFRAAQSGRARQTPALPSLCRVFERLEMDCRSGAPRGDDGPL